MLSMVPFIEAMSDAEDGCQNGILLRVQLNWGDETAGRASTKREAGSAK